MSNLKSLKIALILPLLFTGLSHAEDQKSSIKSSETESSEKVVEVEAELTARQHTSIIMDEKKRLRDIYPRRKKSNELKVQNFYIEELKVDELTKGFLRESVFYLDYFLEKIKEDDKEAIRNESENYLWNILCVSNQLELEKYHVTFQTLNEMVVKTDEDKKAFQTANNIVASEMAKMEKISIAEIKIRCLDVYGRN